VEFPEGFREANYEFMKKHLADGNLGVWIAEDKGKLVSMAMVCYYSLLPSIDNKTGITGYIQNVYTISEYRGQGLASELVNRIKQDAKDRNVGALYLHASDMGRPVYEKLGFEILTKEMGYTVD
jgi:GNAT superfamily N-acetyltransferase